MVSTNYRDFGKDLVASRRVSIKRIDDAVRRILRIKFRAGLFEHPYVDVAAAPGKQLLPANRDAARVAAGSSIVLLKNDGNVLPLKAGKKTALIGPLGDSAHDMLGPWWGRGDDNDAVSLFAGMKAQNPNTTYTPGCTLSHNDLDDPAGECSTDDGFAAAVAAAQAADQVVLAVGETREMSGEAEARSNIDLPGRQQELIDAIKATGKPFTVVLFNGRPLTLAKVDAASPAILEAWFGGVEAGNARRRRRCSARSTPAASCRSRSRATSARSRSTTTTSRPAARATRRRSTTRATATSRPARRCTSSATASATRPSRSPTCGCPRTRCPRAARSRRASTSPTPARSPATRSPSSTSTTRSRASRSRSAACAASSA